MVVAFFAKHKPDALVREAQMLSVFNSILLDISSGFCLPKRRVRDACRDRSDSVPSQKGRIGAVSPISHGKPQRVRKRLRKTKNGLKQPTMTPCTDRAFVSNDRCNLHLLVGFMLRL